MHFESLLDVVVARMLEKPQLPQLLRDELLILLLYDNHVVCLRILLQEVWEVLKEGVGDILSWLSMLDLNREEVFYISSSDMTNVLADSQLQEIVPQGSSCLLDIKDIVDNVISLRITGLSALCEPISSIRISKGESVEGHVILANSCIFKAGTASKR